MLEQIFDRGKVRIHRDRTACELTNHDFLFKHCSKDIVERVSTLNCQLDNILEIGARNAFLTSLLQTQYRSSNYTLTDISYNMLSLIDDPSIRKIQNDEEHLCFQENSFDLIVSALNIQWINNFPNFLYQIKSILKPNGYFIANFFGGNNLPILKRSLIKLEIDNLGFSMPHFMPIFEIDLLIQVLHKIGFRETIVDSENIEVKYSSLSHLINDIKLMGESSKMIRGCPLFSRKVLDLIIRDRTPISENFEVFNIVVKK